MKKLIMYVYNDITTDARVQRAAEALAGDYDLTLISTQKGKTITDKSYRNVLVGGRLKGAMDIFDTIFSSLRFIRKQKPDVVYCHDYYSAILAYLLIKTRFSGKIIYDAHELMIPEKGHKDRRLNFFYWFEKRIVKKVDLLVCASEERGQIMKRHYGLKNVPYVVPNISQLSVNDEDEDVKAVLATLTDFFSDTKPTVVYAGAVTSSRRINELVDAAVALHDHCKLLIVGKGDALDALKVRALEHPGLHVAFTGSVPYKCLGSILSRCDIGFLYYPNDSLNNRYCASNKIYEYASVGLPMLANDNITVKQMLDNSQIGLSTNDFRKGLSQLIRDCKKFKSNCDVFTANNLWSDQVHRLKEAVFCSCC